MTTVITYGTYDHLHRGHVRLLERAKALGDYLIVGVTSDDFDKQRGKINVQQPLEERVAAVRATELADKIIVEEYEGQKIDDLPGAHAGGVLHRDTQLQEAAVRPGGLHRLHRPRVRRVRSGERPGGRGRVRRGLQHAGRGAAGCAPCHR